MAKLRLTDKLLTEIQERALQGDAQEYWIKACRGRLAVHVVNPFTGEPEVKILKGDPTVPDEALEPMLVALYTDHDAKFFKETNRSLIRQGLIVAHTPEFKKEQMVNAITDEEIVEALEKPFFALKALLDRFTSPIPVERLLRKAKELDKTSGFIDAIENRLAELQADEYSSGDS